MVLLSWMVLKAERHHVHLATIRKEDGDTFKLLEARPGML